jgi:hypothetical protein
MWAEQVWPVAQANHLDQSSDKSLRQADPPALIVIKVFAALEK